jgi:hypothetical protein
MSGHLSAQRPLIRNSHQLEDVLLDDYADSLPLRVSGEGTGLQQAQETIFNFLLDVVKQWPPEEVLLEFKHLFLNNVDSVNPHVVESIYTIVFNNDEEEFRNTIKRCCYILVNNWDASRNYKPIQELVQSFLNFRYTETTISPTLKRLRTWVENFTESRDYEELKLFSSRYDEHHDGPWSSRYTAYLLVPQFVDLRNPVEQREAARALSQQLRDRFKFELAMYIIRSQNTSAPERIPKNPTVLGDSVLRLIKMIVAKRGAFSYASLANIFLNQVDQLNYQEFKQSLQRYLFFGIENNELVEILKEKLSEKLSVLYEDYHGMSVNDALLLRTCNRIIEYLTTENRQDPSALFILLLSQTSPMTLVLVLLKLILICKNSRTHLDARIADLIKYYEKYPEGECYWVVNFLEVFNVTFAIYTENVQYNLIRMVEEGPSLMPLPHSQRNLDAYRVFSQLKRDSHLLEDSQLKAILDIENQTIDPPPDAKE